MKTLHQKLDQAVRLSTILIKETDRDGTPRDRFYFVFRILQDIRSKIREEAHKNDRIGSTEVSEISNVCYFDKPERTITSSTYERAKKRLERQIDIRFMNR